MMADKITESNEIIAGKILLLLDDICGGLDDLYSCLRQQQKALTQWRMADFLDTVILQRKLAEENISRERQRLKLAAELVGESVAETANLRTLAEHLGGQWPTKFREASARIKPAAARVDAMKNQNEMLISSNREMVGDQLRLMFELASLNRNTYAKSGRKAGRTDMYKVLDQRV
jgi:hypothetical protein